MSQFNHLLKDLINSVQRVSRSSVRIFEYRCDMKARLKQVRLAYLAAPLVVAQVTGCALPMAESNSFDHYTVQQREVDRAERMISIAERHACEGRVDLADKICAHVLAQEKDNVYVKQRIEGLVQRGMINRPATPSFSFPAVEESDELRYARVTRPSSNTERVPASKLVALPGPDFLRQRQEIMAGHLKKPDHFQQNQQLAQTPTVLQLPGGIMTAQENSATFIGEFEAEPTLEPVYIARQDSNQTPLDSQGWRPASDAVKNLPSVDQLFVLQDHLPNHLKPVIYQLGSESAEERMKGLMVLRAEGQQIQNADEVVTTLTYDADAMVSLCAASTLHEIVGTDAQAIDVYRRHLKNADDEVACMAAYLLGECRQRAESAIGDLSAVRDSKSGSRSLHAAEALYKIQPEDSRSVQAMAAALKDSDKDVRWQAVLTLGTVNGEHAPIAVEALIHGLQDRDAEVRSAAALSLGGMGAAASAARTHLEETAINDVPDVRFAAETALTCLKM